MRRLCTDLPRVGGLVKAAPEDFEVEEVAAYLPSGEGEHLFLWVEKRGRTTQDVIRELGLGLGLRQGDLGVAGQKDRQAVTRQWISVPAAALDAASRPEGDGWRVLEARRHGNKLRTGHLSGNRFRIRLRGAGPDLEAAQACLERLGERGLPNYFGPQRFGRDGDNAAQGRALLEGRLRPRDRFKRRLLLSALQSELFNTWLDRRIDDGLLDGAVLGDLLEVRASGGLFRCDDPAVDGPRVRAGELDPTGPIFGHRVRSAAAEAGEREAVVLAEAGLTLAAFETGGRDAQGTRRSARVSLGEPQVEASEADLILAFTLPAGSYATVLLAELAGSS